ncbi:hypothetical protein QWY82_10170 [Simiduia curdlanivorans]|uniref:Yippee domain-containing protein n=1 Tax=Simiduia curdlanivorans TaxID=1492769 RepID=A0ABV8V031_9GAMM|nr:hypothetical protein [Simiduia curdlanivorans]MDN3639175.1 hypothetical protein [Simiduia curdlanivorans]
MDTRIIGNTTYCCSACGYQHAIDANTFSFEMGSPARNDPESEGRYEALHLNNCIGCSETISIAFEVWEYPAGATNYCYHSELGANKIQCEFAIEYYHADGEESAERESTSSYSEDDKDGDQDDYEGPEDYEGSINDYDEDGKQGRLHHGGLDDFEVSDD